MEKWGHLVPRRGAFYTITGKDKVMSPKIKDKFKNTTHVAAVVRKEWGTTIWKSLTK